MYGVHVRCFKHAENNAHVRRTQSSHMCGVHVRRTCTAYMYHSINTPLIISDATAVQYIGQWTYSCMSGMTSLLAREHR